MFERFTDDARRAVRHAEEEARRLRHGWIGTEHLLLGLLAEEDSLAARALREHGVDHRRAEAMVARLIPERRTEIDAEALETIGIDLGAVRDKVEAAFGPGALDGPPATNGRLRAGHIPLCRRTKKSLELALRETVRLRHKRIADGHVLLGVLREGHGLACRALRDAGVDLDALRKDVEATIG